MKYIQNFKKTIFFKNAFGLTIGTILSQVISIGFYPVLTRLYTPSEFGLFSLISSIATILSVIASGGFEHIVILAETKKIATNIIWLILIISFATLSTIEVLFYFFSNYFEIYIHSLGIQNWVYLAPPLAFLILYLFVLNELCLKSNLIKSISFNKILNVSSITLLKLVFGLFKLINGGLLIAEVLARFFTLIVSSIFAYKFDKNLFKRPKIDEILQIAKKFKDAPKYILPSQVLNSVGGQLPTIFLAFTFSKDHIGQFAMANAILALPSSLFSLAIRDAFKKHAYDEFIEYGNCKNFYRKTLIVCAIISLIGFSLFFAIAPNLFHFFLGEKWVYAGQISRILVPVVFVSFVSEILSPMYIIGNKMKLLIIWQIIYLLLTLFSLLFGVFYFKDFKFTLICFTIARTFTHFISILFTTKVASGYNIS